MRKSPIVLFLLLSLGLGAQEGTGQQEAAAQEEAAQQTENIEQAEGGQQEDSAADDEPDINWDLDSYFDNPSAEIYNEPEVIKDNGPINLRDKITVDVDYGMIAGFSPGWTQTPWYGGKREYSYILGAKLGALLSLDIPLTSNLRVHNVFSFAAPENEIFSIKEFYFEYDFWSMAYLQVGLYETAWGISRFYPFTNLPAMVPTTTQNPGDSYIARLTIPIGIGGLELLGMTRYGYVDDFSSPTVEELAFGMKYNLAFNAADIDVGVLYHKQLPVRSFISVKTTLGNTELYSEGLVAVKQEENPDVYVSGNLGFLRDFFDRTLTVTGEVFYNGEPNVVWWRPETDILEESTVNLFEGLNTALAFVVRPGIIGMRLFAQTLYAYEEESVWLVPGISVSPGGINITLSVPMALGKRSGYYCDNDDRDHRPFSVVLGVSFNGKLRYSL